VKKITYIAIILTLVFQLIGCDRQQQIQPSGKKVKVGIIGPFSGDDIYKGKDGLEGIRTGMQMYPYLDNGNSIELVIEDDKNDPELTVKALKKLTEVENVSAIIILSTSASALAVNTVADEYKTPVIALLATHPDIAKDTSFVTQLCFDNIFQGMVAALYVMDELLIDNVAVFKNPSSYYSTSLADEFIKKYESLGGRVTDIVPVNPATEITEQILDVIRENGAELLYLPIEAKKLIEILQTTEKMSWNPKKMGSDGLLSAVLRKHEKDIGQLEGLLAIDYYTEDVPFTPFGKKASKTYQKLYKSRGSTYVAAGVEGFAVLFRAMNLCNTGDRECINSMLHSTNNFEGLMGKISIQTGGKVVRPLIVNAIKKSRMEFIVKVY